MADKYKPRENYDSNKKYSFNKSLENIGKDLEGNNRNLRKINKRIEDGELDGII